MCGRSTSQTRVAPLNESGPERPDSGRGALRDVRQATTRDRGSQTCGASPAPD